MIGDFSKEGMEASYSDMSKGKLETEILERVLPMHSMHAQDYHFLACSPILLQNLEDQYGSPQGVWS